MNDPAYLKLIMQLKISIERTLTVGEVYKIPANGDPVPIQAEDTLTIDTQYVIYGEYLGVNIEGKPSLGFILENEDLVITLRTWNDEGIKFAFKNFGSDQVSEEICIALSNGKTKISAGIFIIDIEQREINQ